MIRCYVHLFGTNLYIVHEDNMILTSDKPEHATLFNTVEECNKLIKRTELREIDGWEEETVVERIRRILSDENDPEVEDYIAEVESYGDEEAYGPDSTDEEIFRDYLEYCDARC